MNTKTLRYAQKLLMFSLAVVATSMSGPVAADSLLVPQIQVGKPIDATYRCPGGKSFKVTYFNGKNGQSFALFPVDGVPTLMVSTMSADGVRYQAGFMTWWSKGRGGDLYDARVDPDKAVLKGCASE